MDHVHNFTLGSSTGIRDMGFLSDILKSENKKVRKKKKLFYPINFKNNQKPIKASFQLNINYRYDMGGKVDQF